MRDNRDLGNERIVGREGQFFVSRIVLAVSAVFFACFAFAQMRPSPLNRNSRQALQRNNRQPVASQPAALQPNAAATTAVDADADPSALNWDAAPVDIVLQAYGDRVKKTILKDPACPSATITLKSRPGQKLTEEEYIEAIETILEMNGVHLEPYGESFIRALPRKDVRKEGIPLIMNSDTKIGETSRTVSMMINFKNIATDEAQKMLEGLKSNNGMLLVFERTNSILVTDTEQNINRMLEIARMVDVATPVTENVFVRQIKHASAQEIQEAIQKIVEESQKEQEKNGKQPQNQAQQQNRPPFPAAGGLLRRPGQQQQQQAPAGNESLVMSVSDADRGMIRGKVVIVPDERSNKLIFVTSKSNMDFFDKVIESLDVETTPDTVVKVYRLKYAEAEDVSDMINDLIGNAPSAKDSKGNQNQNAKQGSGSNLTQNRGAAGGAKKPANQRTGDAKAGELNKENTTVLSDKRINGLVVMTLKELVPTIEQIIESMDIKLSQVLIETVIIEVSLGDGIETGMDWLQKGRQKVYKPTTDKLGRDLFYTERTVTTTKNGEAYSSSTSYLDNLVPKGYSKSSSSTMTDDNNVTWVTTISDAASSIAGTSAQVARDGFVNYYTGGMGVGLGGGAGGGQDAYNIGSGLASNVFGKAFNFIFDSDKLGLSAIIQATKTDSRSKYIASPIIMTLDNKEAVINATAMHYLLKGFTSSGNSYSTIAVPDYEQKELGIEIKTTPKINPNGTVMLTVEEKYTQLGAEEAIQYSSSNGQSGAGGLQTVQVPTTVTREMSSDVLLENGQTVVFGGLTETTTSESESGIPFLKDIPWVGKWLFGSVKKSETRTELLVFMTPYVLDDSQAAQAEALRRKKTMSDPRPWDDHGWSASELADPVSRKEQLRRLKDEWAKQDEERRTKIAIEKEKVERVKKLESLSKEERDLWLKMHKDEIDKEKQKELEEKMLDKESQEELKKLAADIREKKLRESEKADAEAAREVSQPNEREKIDAAKANAEKKDGE